MHATYQWLDLSNAHWAYITMPICYGTVNSSEQAWLPYIAHHVPLSLLFPTSHVCMNKNPNCDKYLAYFLCSWNKIETNLDIDSWITCVLAFGKKIMVVCVPPYKWNGSLATMSAYLLFGRTLHLSYVVLKAQSCIFFHNILEFSLAF